MYLMKRALLISVLLWCFGLLCFGQDSATFLWNPPSSGGTVQTYEVFVFTSAPAASTTPLTITPTATLTVAQACGTGTTCTYVDTAVSEGSQYWFEVEACNSTPTTPCSAPTTAVSVTIPFQTPGVPTNPTVTAK
jgi:hypothetical protein